MKIGSHNSMTYAEPAHPFFKLFKWAYRCQKLTILEQLQANIRVFDLRVRQNKVGKWVFAHGMVEFKVNPYEVLTLLNTYSCKVRLLWEIDEFHESAPFIEFCKKIQREFPKITFFEGRSKYDWVCVYNFNPDNEGNPSIETGQFVGSMMSWWGKFIPIVWHFFNKEKTRELANNSTKPIVLLDFIEKGEIKTIKNKKNGRRKNRNS